MPLPYRKVYGELQTNLGVVTKDDKVVLPRDLRPVFLQTVHGNHEGVSKMLESAKLCWWPGMDSNIKKKPETVSGAFRTVKTLKLN